MFYPSGETGIELSQTSEEAEENFRGPTVTHQHLVFYLEIRYRRDNILFRKILCLIIYRTK